MPTGTTLYGALSTPGTATATRWGSAVTPSRFFPFVKESMRADMARIDSKAITVGAATQRADRFATYPKSVGGDLEMEVSTKGFGTLLEAMMGTVTTSGPTDGAYTHSATIGAVGSLRGKGLTVQVGRPTANADVQPFTYSGCKVASWTIENSTDGWLTLKVTFIGKTEILTVPLATPSYPSNTEGFSFVGGSVLLDGVQVCAVKKVTVKGDNSLTGDERRFLCPSGLKEPIESGLRSYELDLEAEFQDLVSYRKYVSSTAAGAVGAVVLKWEAPTLIGATTPASITITAPHFRYDGETPTIEGPEVPTIKLSGPCLSGAAGLDALSIDYVSADATP
jgi:hypothetical protein